MKLRKLFEVRAPRDIWKVAALLAALSMPFATVEKNTPWLFMLPVIAGALIVAALNPNVLVLPKTALKSPVDLGKNLVPQDAPVVRGGSSNPNPPAVTGARAYAFSSAVALGEAKVYFVRDAGTVVSGDEEGYRRAKSSTSKIVVNWTVEANHATKAGVSTPAFGLSRDGSEDNANDGWASAMMRSRFVDEGIATTA